MLIPVNKHLVVKPIESASKEQSRVLVPDDFKEDTSPYAFVKLLQKNELSNLTVGDRLLIHAHLMEEVTLEGQVFHIIPENSVIAYVDSK